MCTRPSCLDPLLPVHAYLYIFNVEYSISCPAKEIGETACKSIVAGALVTKQYQRWIAKTRKSWVPGRMACAKLNSPLIKDHH